jgi:hypothetical protein
MVDDLIMIVHRMDVFGFKIFHYAAAFSGSQPRVSESTVVIYGHHTS